MNTRRKRRKVSSTSYRCSPLNDERKGKKQKNDDGKKDAEEIRVLQCHTLETLPPEVLGMILSLMPFADVAGSIRLVSRRCSTIAMMVLNGAFLAAGIRLETTMSYIDKTMSRATTDSDLLAWSRAFNILELIKSQYKMLKAVTWRYTHPPKASNSNRVCFYAGALLDELNNILNIAKIRPRALSTSASSARNNGNNNGREQDRGIGHYEDLVAVATAASPRLVSFIALCKRFMDYFEKVSECKYNRSALVSGCKAVDVLDCLAVGREVTGFRVSSGRMKSRRSSLGNTSMTTEGTNPESTRLSRGEKNRLIDGGTIVTMRLRYVMRRAWFTCLQVPCAEDENSWREDQRFMYLRLRRLVGSVNEHHYEKSHFERDLLLRTSSVINGRGGPPNPIVANQRPIPPAASTYSGYGVYAGRFFYYGHMNKSAYESKFKDLIRIGGDDDYDDSGRDDDGVDEEDEDESERHSNSVASRRGPPAFDLVIRVELRCSSDLAPLAIVSSLRKSEMDFEQSSSNISVDGTSEDTYRETNYSSDNSELYIKLNVTCAASAANRLPTNFTWKQRGSSHS